MITQFLYIVHITLCIGLVFLVLLQHGKGADMGAAFGGGNSNTVFGAGGAPDFLTKLTTSVAVAFMFTSVLLVRSYEHLAHAPTSAVNPLSGSVMEGVQKPAEKKAEAPAPAANEANKEAGKEGSAAAPAERVKKENAAEPAAAAPATTDSAKTGNAPEAAPAAPAAPADAVQENKAQAPEKSQPASK